MSKVWRYLIRAVIEFFGRMHAVPSNPFTEAEIISPPQSRRIWSLIRAAYLSIPPSSYAVMTSPAGQRTMHEGGYVELPPGNYTLQFVDRRERSLELKDIKATTVDGANIALSVGLTYKVVNPIRILEIERPVEVLLAVVTAGVKNFILASQHDDFIAPHNAGHNQGRQIVSSVLDSPVRNYIGSQQNCKAFSLVSIIVTDLKDDERFLELRKQREVQQRESQLEQDRIVQDRLKTEQKQRSEREAAEREGLIQQMRANIEKNNNEIDLSFQKMKFELDNRREQARDLRDIIKIIMQTPGTIRNVDPETLERLISSLTKISSPGTRPSSDEEVDKDIRDMAGTLLNLIRPRGQRG